MIIYLTLWIMHKNDNLKEDGSENKDAFIEKDKKNIIYDDEIFSMCKVTFKGIGAIGKVINCILDDLHRAFDITCFCHD